MHWMGITESNFSNLWLLVIITNLSTLLPLPFLGWLPNAQETQIPHLDSEPASLPDSSAAPVDLASSIEREKQLVPDLQQ